MFLGLTLASKANILWLSRDIFWSMAVARSAPVSVLTVDRLDHGRPGNRPVDIVARLARLPPYHMDFSY